MIYDHLRKFFNQIYFGIKNYYYSNIKYELSLVYFETIIRA